MNRDTLYSFAVVDISKGATVTMPDADDRYMSLMVINNDGYINDVYYGGGTYPLTMEEYGTPFVGLAVRTLVNADDEADLKAVHDLQDQLKIAAAAATAFDAPDYNRASYEATLKPLLELAKGLSGTAKMFGAKDNVNPVHFLIGSAYGWGGLPRKDAVYVNVQPGLPVGVYELTVEDVPVEGFWSISLYNKDGYFQKNDLNAYNVNSVMATKNDDGAYVVRFGGCSESTPNCLPIMDGWNYIVRLYRPEQAILDGSWTFPGPPQPVKP
jgi:hypothetical protein